MCGRFTLQITKEMLAEIFGVSNLQDITPRYNIAPSQQVPVVRVSPKDHQLHIDNLKWGLIPSWAKDPSIGNHMINARSESVEQKPAFRPAIRFRRCIVPASGFYEWQKDGGKKHPYYIKLKDDRPMLLAGLWDHWKAPDGPVVETFTVLTTASNELIQPLHDRMPVILDTKDIDLWLNPKVTDPLQLKSILRPYPLELMEIYKVADLVNSPRNDSPECIKTIINDLVWRNSLKP